MPRNESLYPADWLRIAEKDFVRTQHLFSIHDPEAAGFYLQQAVEKFLKAFLLTKGWQLQRLAQRFWSLLVDEPFLSSQNRCVLTAHDLRNFSSNLDEILRQNIISNATLSKKWEGGNRSLSLNIYRDQNLQTDDVEEQFEA